MMNLSIFISNLLEDKRHQKANKCANDHQSQSKILSKGSFDCYFSKLNSARRQLTKKRKLNKKVVQEDEEEPDADEFWQRSNRRKNFHKEVEQLPTKRQRKQTEKARDYYSQIGLCANNK